MKSRLVVLFIAFIYLFVVFNENKWKQERLLEWDKSGYYLYLPATFIYHDLADLNFYPKVDSQYHFSNDIHWYGIFEQPNTHHRLDKYAIGVSVMQLPFFFIGHFITIITNQYAADGYTPYYLMLLILSAVFYVVLGLVLIRNVLLQYYPDNIVSIVLLLIGLGTNLYSYTAFDYVMSHPYSFFLFATAIHQTQLFYKTKSKKYLITVGVLLGLITITRPTNILIVIALLFWGLKNKQDFIDRFHFLQNNFFKILLSIICFTVVLFIQLSYWKYVTNHWVYFSYQDEGFNFLHSEIWKGLFSYRKGWFVYTPIAFIGMLGFFFSYRKFKVMTMGLLIFFCINIYVIFSWYQWYYGGGFSCRPLIDSLPILAFPLASFTDYIIHKKRIIKLTISSIFVLLILLNIWQTYQYSLGTIPWDHNNREYYWRVFFKKFASEDDWKLIKWD